MDIVIIQFRSLEVTTQKINQESTMNSILEETHLNSDNIYKVMFLKNCKKQEFYESSLAVKFSSFLIFSFI